MPQNANLDDGSVHLVDSGNSGTIRQQLSNQLYNASMELHVSYILAQGQSQTCGTHLIMVENDEGISLSCSPPVDSAIPELGIQEVRGDSKITLIRRTENAGMDLGSHNVTLEYMRLRGSLG